MEHETLNGMASDIGEMKGMLRSCCERLETHHYEIYGNGTPGLKSRMYHAEKQALTAAKSRKAVWSSVLSVLGFVGTAIVSWFTGKS